jgi:hypothetical protein
MIFPIESYYTENNTIRLTQDGYRGILSYHHSILPATTP